MLAFIHLTIITLSIFHVFDSPLLKGGTFERSSAFLGRINYSVWQYGFFSPDVGSSHEVEIKISDGMGDEKHYSTLHGFNFFVANEDLSRRFYGFRMMNAYDTLFQDLCARSVATRMINLHPGISQVTYSIRSIRFPTMNGFCKNTPVDIRTLYTTDFVLRNY